MYKEMPEHHKRIIDKYLSGMTQKEVAESEGMKRASGVNAVLNRWAINDRRAGKGGARPQNEPGEVARHIIAHHESGKSMADIGTAMGVSRQYVQQVLSRWKPQNGIRRTSRKSASVAQKEIDYRAKALELAFLAMEKGVSAREIVKGTGMEDSFVRLVAREEIGEPWREHVRRVMRENGMKLVGSEALIARWKDPAWVAKMMAARHASGMYQRARERWNDPEYRRKVAEGKARYCAERRKKAREAMGLPAPEGKESGG